MASSPTRGEGGGETIRRIRRRIRRDTTAAKADVCGEQMTTPLMITTTQNKKNQPQPQQPDESPAPEELLPMPSSSSDGYVYYTPYETSASTGDNNNNNNNSGGSSSSSSIYKTAYCCYDSSSSIDKEEEEEGGGGGGDDDDNNDDDRVHHNDDHEQQTTSTSSLPPTALALHMLASYGGGADVLAQTSSSSTDKQEEEEDDDDGSGGEGVHHHDDHEQQTTPTPSLPPAALALHMLASYGGGADVLAQTFRGFCPAMRVRKKTTAASRQPGGGSAPIRRRHTDLSSLNFLPRHMMNDAATMSPPSTTTNRSLLALDVKAVARFMHAALHDVVTDIAEAHELAEALVEAIGTDEGQLEWNSLANGLRLFGCVFSKEVQEEDSETPPSTHTSSNVGSGTRKVPPSTISSFASDVAPAPVQRTAFRSAAQMTTPTTAADYELAVDSSIARIGSATLHADSAVGVGVLAAAPVAEEEEEEGATQRGVAAAEHDMEETSSHSPRMTPRPFLGRNLSHLGSEPLATATYAGTVAATWRQHFAAPDAQSPQWSYSARYGGLRRVIKSHCLHASSAFGHLTTVEAQLARQTAPRQLTLLSRSSTPRFPFGKLWVVDRRLELSEENDGGKVVVHARLWAGLKATTPFDGFAAIKAALGGAVLRDDCTSFLARLSPGA